MESRPDMILRFAHHLARVWAQNQGVQGVEVRARVCASLNGRNPAWLIDGERSVILFDGVCNLCTASVRFVIERDARKRFRFASLQSPTAERLLGRRDDLESMVLVENDKVYRKSTAALKIARRLDGAWPLLAAFLVLPRFLRDAVYDWIGRRRYRMFGKRDACWVPSADLSDRFLNSDAH